MTMFRFLRAFARDEDGAFMVFFGIALAVILGFVALSFDVGRIAITQSELQSFADSVALAAAGELDGNEDSITRAQGAAASLIRDSQTFAFGDRTLEGIADYTLTFLTELPDDDLATPTAITTEPREAVYVTVDVTAHEVGLTFWAAFAALRGETVENPDVAATATAGLARFACDVTPLMFCLPYPDFEADAHQGELVRLRSGGNGAAWGPGDFGFLDPSRVLVDTAGPCEGLTGVNMDACLLGAVGSITQCYQYRGVDTEPGQKVGIEDSIFNVRFDMFQTIMQSERNNPDYAPAPHVLKGLVRSSGNTSGNQCLGNNPAISPDTMGLPRDDCFATGGCGRFGDGNWSAGRAAYVDKNYGTDVEDPHPEAETRYEYYLAEIAAAGGVGSTSPILTGRSETGRPVCSPHHTPDPDRRVLIAAGIDCAANPINGQEEDVPVEEFFRMFLIEPVGDDGVSPPTIDIWGEIIGSAENEGAGGVGSGGIFRDVVQLYR